MHHAFCKQTARISNDVSDGKAILLTLVVQHLFVEFWSLLIKSVYKKSNLTIVLQINLLRRRGEISFVQIWS
jgi:hypothetical protein